MSKFLLIGSVAAMLYGDCAWGIEEIDPWADMSSRNSIDSRENAPALNSGQFSDESARENASPNIRSRRNSTTFSQDAQTQTEQSPFEQFRSGQAQANPQQLQENRFIKDNGYRQYLYVLSNNSKIGYATPTKIVTIAGDLKNWNDISVIRYANDVSYDKLENPKVILYRNKDNSCYIILRTDDGKKYGVFYGLNERNVEIGRNSFAVYDVSEDVGSFTDGVPRRIYVDESGLYFVPIEGNSIKDVIKTYQNEGKFNFKGSVIKVSAIDGTITLDDAPVTEDNFFDNWVLEEKEIKKSITGTKGESGWTTVKETKTVVSKKTPKKEEMFRNFYPPKGEYYGLIGGTEPNPSYRVDYKWLPIFAEPSEKYNGKITTLRGREWINFFVDKRLQSTKEMNVQKCEELVRDGTFVAILRHYNNDKKISDIVVSNGGSTSHRESDGYLREYRNSPRDIIWYNAGKLSDPSFVKNLKQGFAGIGKDYEYTKGTDLWIPFEIVRNL